MTPLLRTLAVLSALELLSVVVLFGNLATVHDHRITSVLGPVHGAIYLAVAVTALLGRDLASRTRVGALIPVLSGPLTMLNVRREARAV
ncbi:hypothetical protein [Mycobacterium shigaense]|uniref:Uncharacterized protein n=1 Tax=Mycobacterium shigaense TaxID=722731 RepID=A0A1Z4EN44_9MYCO|nr:hypothetical protein [Mycobacterium shigaense]MEA1120595.1 hypothetical protein [Mycobacterium shigaense]PRI14184.1 hypothetical protein B2J96_15795 [Mycobacterium shigaense]BAX94330.1 hypothetical protein MSG_04209 [Mycobacterium shigaense]